MTPISRALSFLMFGALLSIGAGSAGAAPIGPGYPAPGNNNYSWTGDAGRDAGQTATYSAFDFGAFDQLWWGPQDITAGGDNNSTALSLASMSGMTAIWQGTTTFNTDSGPVNVGTRFTVTITSGSPGWIDPSSVSITPGPQAVAEITSGPFVVNEKFTVFDTGTGFDIDSFLDYYDTHHLSTVSGTGHTDFSGSMYYTNPAGVGAVPLPAALPLFASGLGGLGLLGWRRSKRKKKAAA